MRYVMLLVFALGLASCGGDEAGRYQFVRKDKFSFVFNTSTGELWVHTWDSDGRPRPADSDSEETR